MVVVRVIDVKRTNRSTVMTAAKATGALAKIVARMIDPDRNVSMQA